MDLVKEKLRELIPHTQTTSFGEKGVSVFVIADLLGVESVDLLNAMEKRIRVFNWKGFGDAPPYYYKKPSPPLWGHVGWWSLSERAKISRPVAPLIIGWFGTTLGAEHLTREEGVLIRAEDGDD